MDFLNEFGNCFHDICIKPAAESINQAFRSNMGGGQKGGGEGGYKPKAPACTLGGGVMG